MKEMRTSVSADDLARPLRFSRRRRWQKIVVGALLLGATAAGTWQLHQRRTLATLERQLALAQTQRSAEGMREIARRISALDDSPERQLRLAEMFLAARLFPEAENAVAAALHASLDRPPDALRLQAELATLRRDWPEAIVAWREFLDRPGAASRLEQRLRALDNLARALAETHQLATALGTLDERLHLADGVAPRMTRALLLLRTAQWEKAAADFGHLRQIAPDDPAVKPLLPPWERVARAQAELSAADAAVVTAAVVSANPGPIERRLERAMLAARVGLWQLAADDFSEVQRTSPQRFYPRLMLALLPRAHQQTLYPPHAAPARVDGDNHDHDTDDDFATASPEPLVLPFSRRSTDRDSPVRPVLASSEALTALLDRLREQRALWDRLAAADHALASQPTAAARRITQAATVSDLGWPALALPEVKAVLRTTPDFLPGQRAEIAILLALRRSRDAEDAAESAIRTHAPAQGSEDHADAELVRLLGLARQANGKHARAVEAFDAYLATLHRADVLRARARSLRFLQRFTAAADDLAAAETLEAASTKAAQP